MVNSEQQIHYSHSHYCMVNSEQQINCSHSHCCMVNSEQLHYVCQIVNNGTMLYLFSLSLPLINNE